MIDKNLKKNFIWNTIGIFSISLTSFVYSLILIRLCNLSVSGIWSYTFAVACTSVTLASFGGRTYQVTDAKKELNTFTYVSARYITVGITLVLVLLFTLTKGFDLNKSLIMIGLCIFKFCEELSDVYYGILQKHDKLYVVGKSMFFKSVINMLLFLMVIYLSKSLLLAVIFILVNNFLFFYFYDRRNALKLEKLDKKISRQQMKKYFKNNLIICLTLFLSTYLVNCSKYVMETYLSDDLQGIYNILVLPATAVTLIGSFIINPLVVGLSKDFAEGQINHIKTVANKISLIMIGFGVIACIGAYFLGVPVLKLIYNFDLTPYLIGFELMIIGCVFYTISTIHCTILITARKLMSQLILNALLAIFSYGLCVILIKSDGINGGIYAYLITMLIRFIIYMLMVNMLKENKNEKEKSSSLIIK